MNKSVLKEILRENMLRLIEDQGLDVSEFVDVAAVEMDVPMAVMAERSRWDVDGDNKIGMAEAIHALQIMSGTTIQHH